MEEMNVNQGNSEEMESITELGSLLTKEEKSNNKEFAVFVLFYNVFVD